MYCILGSWSGNPRIVGGVINYICGSLIYARKSNFYFQIWEILSHPTVSAIHHSWLGIQLCLLLYSKYEQCDELDGRYIEWVE